MQGEGAGVRGLGEDWVRGWGVGVGVGWVEGVLVELLEDGGDWGGRVLAVEEEGFLG